MKRHEKALDQLTRKPAPRRGARGRPRGRGPCAARGRGRATTRGRSSPAALPPRARPRPPMFVLTFCLTVTVGELLATFKKPVLGCIDAEFCKYTRLKALDEIYKMYALLHRSAFENSAKFRQTFAHFLLFYYEIFAFLQLLSRS